MINSSNYRDGGMTQGSWFALLNLIFLACIMIVINGASLTPPHQELLLISSDIFTQNLPPSRFWLNESLLVPLLMYVFGVSSQTEFLIFILILTLSQIMLQFYIIQTSLPQHNYINLYFIFSGCLTSIFFWLGYADPTLFLSGTICSVCFMRASKSSWSNQKLMMVVGVITFISTIAHYQGTFFILLIAAILYWRRDSMMLITIAFVCWFTAFSGLQYFFHLFEFQGDTRLEYLARYGVFENLSERMPENILMLLLGIFGSGIIFIANGWPGLSNFLSNNPNNVSRIAVSIIIALTVGLVVYDTTRVLCWISWPIILFVLSKSEQKFNMRTIFPIVLICGLALPPNHYWHSTYHQRPLNASVYESLDSLYKNITKF